MTLQEFLDKLKTTEGPWKVGPTGALRCGEMCPITAVDGQGLDADMWTISADRLVIPDPIARRFVHAADGDVGFDIDLRYALLAATVNR